MKSTLPSNRSPPGFLSGVSFSLGCTKRAGAAVALLAAVFAAAVQAADPEERRQNLGDLSLEELMNETVTSVSKRVQKLSEAGAAITVLTNDDLRRSGATTVADALRLVPGMQVGAIDASTWAVSARGFNSQYSNKLLVMIDGRSVYSPLFSGVYWDAQQVMLDDVERIEVIRGPGATVWGANAVNGVINILSKSARDTQGGLLYGGGGDVAQVLGGARYGGQINADTFYRVYGTYQRYADSPRPNGPPANDDWELRKGGFRLDHFTGGNAQLTWQGDTYAGDLAGGSGDLHGFNTLGRWTQVRSDRSSYEVQIYFDRAVRNDFPAESRIDTVDLAIQHTLGLGERHDFVWGLGYRFTGTQLQANTAGLALFDDAYRLNHFSAFVQDEFKVIPDRLSFTLGTKIEHNDFTGIELQPSAGLVFKPSDQQTLWAAVSRAVRTPSAFEGRDFFALALGAPVAGPGGGFYVPTFGGNVDVESEVLWAYELGYRVQPGPRLSLEVAAFYNDYRRLMGQQLTGFVPGIPVGVMELESANVLRGESHGGEAVLTFAATETWRISASYSLLRLHLHGELATDIANLEMNAPTHQVVLRSSSDLSRRTSLDVQVRYVDQVREIPAYVTADVRLSWRPTDSLELSLVGRNLVADQHAEQASNLGAPTTGVPRGFHGRIGWCF